METGLEIAVIGMAGRYPGAGNIHELWDNLKNGVESITFFSNEELLETGIDPQMLEDPNYVKAGSMLTDFEYFDADFFGYTPREAEIMDPQMRIFHECAWTALEDAGYDPLNSKSLIGLYAGAATSINWLTRTLLSGKNQEMGTLAFSQLTQKEFLSMRVSYKLNLNGPSVFLYTTCSTSLVAIHMGYQALLNGECDIALAGGITVIRLGKAGYMYEEGMINSPDGHCRAFDADAKGLVGADGVGVVVLKRLRDAVSERDHIYAVIKGSAVNNDGMQKAGFTAPSVKGQAEVIKMAMQMAEVEPESIGYIETHGTGTGLGDPVEIEGLKRAFKTGKKGFCGIGSVKTNFGHADCAAGVAGFMKIVLTINHRLIPPSLHFQTPNPGLDFIDSPFYVNSKLTPWENDGFPLRAGVSSFGQGGTNAHLILEEWGDAHEESRREREPQGTGYLIALSARTSSALDKIAENLVRHFKENPQTHPADAEFTLLAGRHAFKYRKMFVCSGIREAVDILETPDSHMIRSSAVKEGNRPVIFLFPGDEGEEGFREQYKNIGETLYRQKPIFRKEMDRCLKISKSQPPVRFAFQYALAKMLMECGIKPHAAIGEVRGETAAECLSGEVSLEDVLKSMMRTPAAEINTPGPITLSFSDRLKQLSRLENPVFLYFGSNVDNIEKILAGVEGFSGHLVQLLSSPQEERSDLNFLLSRIGCLWLYGINVDWERFYSDEQKYRISLPTYPFEGRRYWIEEAPFEFVMVNDSDSPEIPQSRQETEPEASSPSLYPRPELSCEYIPPSGETEIKLAGIWQQFFGFEKIGSRDDFFELGGDSLKIIMLVSMIRKDLNVRVPIPEFFDRPNIKELSQYVRTISSDSDSVLLVPVEKKEYYELSFAQKRMFIIHQINKNGLSYNIPYILSLKTEIDHEMFLQGFKRLIIRHETLRSSFIMLPDGPVQVIHEDVPFSIEYFEKNSEEDIPEIVNKFVRPFDMGKAPVMRVGLIKTNPAEYVLMLDTHHIISDAFSFGVLTNDFFALYENRDLPLLEIQYKDFSEWQNRLYRSGEMDKQKEYWMGAFEGGDKPELNIPLDFPRPAVRDVDKGDHLTFILEDVLREKLYVVLNRTETTLPMILFAVYCVLLSVYTKQEDIVVGMLNLGRSHADLGNLIGMFVNTLPIRSQPRNDKTFGDFLKEIKRIMLNAYENQDYPYDELIVDLGLQGSSGRNPLFDVVFTYNSFDNSRTKAEKTESDVDDIQMEPLGSPVEFAKFDLYFQVNEVFDSLSILLRYSTQVFKPSTIEKIKKYYIEILEQVLDDITVKLKDISFSHTLTTVTPSVQRSAEIDFNL